MPGRLRASVVVALAFLAAACGRGEAPLDHLPEAPLVALDGTPTDTGVLRGGALLLNAWAPWCSSCLRELPALQRLAGRGDLPLQVVGIAPGEERFLVIEFRDRHGIRFPTYLDVDDGLVKRLGVSVYPHTFLIGADGRVLRQWVGEQDWDAPARVEELARALDGAA